MKLQTIQALATVLNIQVVQGEPGKAPFFACSDHPEFPYLGVVGKDTLTQAVWRAMELRNLEADSNFAVFPMDSNRENFYMAIERELLRQEAHPDLGGKKMWELMSNNGDPREIVTTVMGQFRECAMHVVSPEMFRIALIRTGCLLIASLQWADDWIGRLKLRNAALKSATPPPPEAIPFPSEPNTAEPAPVSTVFGDAGLRVAEDTLTPDIPWGKEELCPTHGEPYPCSKCPQAEVQESERKGSPTEEALLREARMHEADRLGESL